MAYTKFSPQPALRDPSNSAVDAPGIYPNEVAVTLDTGELVAVFCERTWQENNAGLVFYASARFCNADWSTQLDHTGKEIVTEFQHSCRQEDVAQFGVDPLTVEHIKAVLGEALTQVPIPNPDPAPAPQTMPMIPWSADFLASTSIRTAVHATGNAGEVSGLATLI